MKALDLLSVLLTVLFVGLKLASIIAWSWWLVLMPLWLPFAIAGAILLGGLLFIMATGGVK